MAGNNLTLTTPSYSTTTVKFGTASLASGYGLAPGGIITGYPYTIECWVNTTIMTGSTEFFIGQNNLISISSVPVANIFAFSYNFPNSSIYNTDAYSMISNGSWHHIAVTTISQNLSLNFVDGTLVGSYTAIPAATSFTQGTFGIGILYSSGSYLYPFTGYIDEVVVWNEARYLSNFTPNTSAYTGTEGMTALYHFDSNGNDSSSAIPTISNRTMTMTSATYDASTEKFGQAALSGGYGVMPNTNPPVQGYPFTVECWAKATTVPTAVSIAVGQSACFGIGAAATGKYEFIVGGTTTVTTTSVPSGSWNHLALVATATLATMYVNGQVAGTLASPGTLNYTAVPAYVNSLVTTTNPWLGEVDEVAIWNTAQYTGTFTPPTVPYIGTEGMVSLFHLSGNGFDYALPNISSSFVPATNSNIVYSPYTWNVTNEGAFTTCAGAYFRMMFTGSYCVLLFDTSNSATYFSEIYYRVDAYETQAPWTLVTLTQTPNHYINVTFPTNTASNTYHLIEVKVKSTSIYLIRYFTPSSAAVVFRGCELSQGATLVVPPKYSKNVLYYGDSITEGYYSVNNVGGTDGDPDAHDNQACSSSKVCEMLPAEYGIVAYGATGWQAISPVANSAPSMQTYYNTIAPGVPRSFTNPAPDLVIFNHGVNDFAQSINGGTLTFAVVQAAIQNVLGNILSATPTTTKLAVLQPFNAQETNATYSGGTIGGVAYTFANYCASLFPAAISALAATYSGGSAIVNSRVSYISTAGFLNATYGLEADGAHPICGNHIGQIAPQLASVLQPFLFPTINRNTHS
jgi:lysophospholipase L1-like esterase